MAVNQGIKEGIEKAGSQAKLGERLGKRQQLIWKYLHEVVMPPTKVALQMEADPELQVPRWKTRPDEFEKPEGA